MYHSKAVVELFVLSIGFDEDPSCHMFVLGGLLSRVG